MAQNDELLFRQMPHSLEDEQAALGAMLIDADCIREGAVYIVEQSICMKEQCQKYSLPYFETARGREQMFQHFLQEFDF